MASTKFARIASGRVVELISIDTTLDPVKIFGNTITLVNVSSGSPPVTVGMVAIETAGNWAFSAAPAPVARAPVVPIAVTPYQAKAALFAIPGAEKGKTLLDDVTNWAAAEGGLLQLAWTEATVITRTGNFVTLAAAKFSWSSAELDAMFIAAAAISA